MAVKRSSTGSTSGSSSRPAAGGDSSLMSAETEVALMAALLSSPLGHRPLGPARHFQVALVYEKMVMADYRDVTPKMIWQYLNSLYDLEGLQRMAAGESAADASSGDGSHDGDDSDEENFVEFSLPKREFSALMSGGSGTSTPTSTSRGAGGASTGSAKRPTRSTPRTTPAKGRRK